MSIDSRISNYRSLEARRQRPLVVYATSTRPGVAAMMAGDAVREFIDQIDRIPANDTAVDVLIHSTGGDALAAWKLMSVLRERFEAVSVLVPNMAFSAATIFALGADEIVMHPHASLGPIDPQVAIKLADGSTRRFSFEDVGAFLRFVALEMGLTEQAHLSVVVDKLFSTVDPVQLGGAKRASELSTEVGERLLQMHMKKEKERSQTRSIAENLNKSFFAHGDAVSRSRARSLQLKVAKDDPDLEQLIWQAYLGIEEHMNLRSPFKPLEHFLANGGAAAIPPTAPLVLPPNTPPQVVSQVWNQVVQAAFQAMAQPAVEVPYAVVNAMIESARIASEFVTSGRMTAARVAGGEIQLAAVETASGWRSIPIVPQPNAGQTTGESPVNSN